MGERMLRRGAFPSKCEIVEEDGKKFIKVPVEDYKWVVCVPKTGEYVETVLGDGEVTRTSNVHVGDEEDWSYNVDVFLDGHPLGPFKRLEIILDRDSDDMLPVVRLFDMVG